MVFTLNIYIYLYTIIKHMYRYFYIHTFNHFIEIKIIFFYNYIIITCFDLSIISYIFIFCNLYAFNIHYTISGAALCCHTFIFYIINSQTYLQKVTAYIFLHKITYNLNSCNIRIYNKRK